MESKERRLLGFPIGIGRPLSVFVGRWDILTIALSSPRNVLRTNFQMLPFAFQVTHIARPPIAVSTHTTHVLVVRLDRLKLGVSVRVGRPRHLLLYPKGRGAESTPDISSSLSRRSRREMQLSWSVSGSEYIIL